MSHVKNNSGYYEWYTPPKIMEAVRNTMGSISLDPASHPLANEVVKAGHFYTEEDNGLNLPWYGKVFLNPPYQAKLIKQFVDKFIKEYVRCEDEYGNPAIEQAIVLVNNATETQWFKKLSQYAKVFCFPTGRIKHYSSERVSKVGLQGQCLMGFSVDSNAFVQNFSPLGLVMAGRIYIP